MDLTLGPPEPLRIVDATQDLRYSTGARLTLDRTVSVTIWDEGRRSIRVNQIGVHPSGSEPVLFFCYIDTDGVWSPIANREARELFHLLADQLVTLGLVGGKP